MTELENARKEIENIDRKMAELFERRMDISGLIGEYKRKNSLPIRDAEREHTLTEKNLSYIVNDELKPYYVEFLRKIMELSRKYQEML